MIEVNNDIKNLCGQLLELYKSAIEDSGHSASHQLMDTASFDISVDDRYFTVYFNLQQYWQYLENGTKPHFPPISAIEQWIRVKPIIPRAVRGKIPSTTQLAYAIARKISIDGTPATKVLQKTMNSNEWNDIIDQLIDDITNIIEKQINTETDEVFE